MDLRMLESVRRAVPIVLRHLDGYVELMEQDLSAAKAAAVSKVKALMLLGVSAVFAVLFACLLLVALAWDSDYRTLVIGIIAGTFALVAVASATIFARKREVPFASLKREWREDRALVKSLITPDSQEETSP
jgi:uncharacterized membrane protein YqjE